MLQVRETEVPLHKRSGATAHLRTLEGPLVIIRLPLEIEIKSNCSIIN